MAETTPSAQTPRPGVEIRCRLWDHGSRGSEVPPQESRGLPQQFRCTLVRRLKGTFHVREVGEGGFTQWNPSSRDLRQERTSLKTRVVKYSCHGEDKEPNYEALKCH